MPEFEQTKHYTEVRVTLDDDEKALLGRRGLELSDLANDAFGRSMRGCDDTHRGLENFECSMMCSLEDEMNIIFSCQNPN